MEREFFRGDIPNLAPRIRELPMSWFEPPVEEEELPELDFDPNFEGEIEYDKNF